MLVLDEEDSITITQAILAMRGVNQKKHKEKQADGNLLLPIRTMAYKGAATAWMRSLIYIKKMMRGHRCQSRWRWIP